MGEWESGTMVQDHRGRQSSDTKLICPCFLLPLPPVVPVGLEKERMAEKPQIELHISL